MFSGYAERRYGYFYLSERHANDRKTKALQSLNHLAKDSHVADAEIQTTLAEMREKRKALQQQIEKAEDALTQTLSPRAQLHLTLLGVLDNGLPRRIGRQQNEKKNEAERTETSEK